jgi:predicted GNAT family acetyltransferase
MSGNRVIDNTQAHRFEIFVGDDVAGYAEYRAEDGAVALTHTVVEPRFEGQGIGSALASGALDAVRASGGSVLPYCPFIRSYIQRHPAYLELVPAGRRAEFALSPGDPSPDRP